MKYIVLTQFHVSLSTQTLNIEIIGIQMKKIIVWTIDYVFPVTLGQQTSVPWEMVLFLFVIFGSFCGVNFELRENVFIEMCINMTEGCIVLKM